jgi:hypothetical protein
VGMQFTEKLTKEDFKDVQKMTGSKTDLQQILILYVAYPILFIMTIIKSFRQANINWTMISFECLGLATGLLISIYVINRARAQRLSQLNATRPDKISLIDDGVKYDGPNGAISLFPWTNFKGWREGRRIMLIERTQGNKFVILPVASLSEFERIPIRQFFQSHIPPVNLRRFRT